MSSRTRFQILKIIAYSDQPVRNSVGELVFGSHVLWEKGNATDHNSGSHSPQVYSYDFDSPVSSNSSIYVTVALLDTNLIGGQYCLHGTSDNILVFESDVVCIDSCDPVTITAKVIQPVQSRKPFSWNGVFTWGLAHKLTGDIISCNAMTRLELYWVSKDTDLLFLHGRSGIPADFLRRVVPGLKSDTLKLLQDVPTDQMVTATYNAYYNFSKIYDTVFGASHFGLSMTGGRFQYSYYIASRTGGAPGSLQPIVNCYDQAAMVQVSTTVGTNRASWLLLNPFGYINTTYLVGVPSQCNNPFFNSVSPPLPPLIGINDQRRTAFGNHVFNGTLSVWNPTNDFIYDSCGGPFYGPDPQTYVSATIDTTTNLYGTAWRPGTVADIAQFNGVTSVTRINPGNLRKSKMVEDLLNRSFSDIAKSTSQVHWDDVATWAGRVIGPNIDVAFHEIHVGIAVVEALWHLTGVDYGAEDDNLVFRVKIDTCVGSDGKLDVTESSAAALNDLRFALKNTQIELGPDDEVLKTLWEPASLSEFAGYSLQLRPSISRGRILLVSGNAFIDISGSTSSASLKPIVHNVLSHTTVDKPSSLDIPKVTDHLFDIPESGRGDRDNVVKGIGTRFSVSCHVSGLIVAATADVADFGLLLQDETIERNASQNTSTVKFTFVTRTLGKHDVSLRFASVEALTSSIKEIEVEVVGY